MSSEPILLFPSLSFFSQSIECENSNPRYLPIHTRRTRKITLVLDLDETLVHSSSEAISDPDNIVYISSSAGTRTLYVKYRPGMLEFLHTVSKKFELVVYTASTQEYAEQVISKIDPRRKILKHRLFRQNCVAHSGFYIKNLERLGRDLSQVVIIDDSITAFAYHLNNGIPIRRWIDDPCDKELEKASSLLERLLEVPDVRPVLNSLFNLPKLLQDFQSQMNFTSIIN